MTPRDAIIAVTHHCNAHCIMCNVWRQEARDRLQPGHMSRLPASLRTINFTGGEPFLRKDLPEFVRVAHRRCPRAQITISTNAYLPERVLAAMDEILAADPSVRLAVSLDAVGEAHDRIRGDSGAFDAAVELIDSLAERGYRGLRLGMTLTGENVGEFARVAQFAARRGLELGVVAAHAAETHLKVSEAPGGGMRPDAQIADGFADAISGWLRSWRPKQWLRAHFAWGTWLRLLGRPWRVRCMAGREFFFLQADGTVFSCSVRGRVMGNLVDQPWEEVWTGPSAEAARGIARRCPERCWMICTVRPAYRRRPLRTLGWIAAAKVRAHLRRLRMPSPAAGEG